MLLSWADSEVMVLVCPAETASACEYATLMAKVPSGAHLQCCVQSQGLIKFLQAHLLT